MRGALFSALVLLCNAAVGGSDDTLVSTARIATDAVPAAQDFVAIPSATNVVRLRLHTNASPVAPFLFNTFDLEAYGEILLRSPGAEALKSWLPLSPTNASLHQLLIDGRGPGLASSNGMIVVERAAGPDWQYIALDASGAYRDRLKEYRRGILFVEPDLFVIHDHIAAAEPVNFQMLLHPPAASRLDEVWRDLRFETPNAGFRAQAPGEKRMPRSWECIETLADSFLPGTITMRLGPTNRLARLDLITVFAVYRGGEKKDYLFKLLQSHTAVGVRIHREGLPTLVAFRTDPLAGSASLTGFEFSGPVGVDVFRPKRK